MFQPTYLSAIKNFPPKCNYLTPKPNIFSHEIIPFEQNTPVSNPENIKI